MSSLIHELFKNMFLELSFCPSCIYFLEGSFSSHSKNHCIEGCISTATFTKVKNTAVAVYCSCGFIFIYIALFHNVILI